MHLYRHCILVLFIASMPISSAELQYAPSDRVMNMDEFKQVVNNNHFLKQIHKTIDEEPLGNYEIEMIELAKKNQNVTFGSSFDAGREISNFTGDTLLIGGGKKPGLYGENQGKTVLIDTTVEEQETKKLIDNLTSGKWVDDPYTGRNFKTNTEKRLYIKKIKAKQALYKEAYREWNKDILSRYYTLNIDKDVQPDMLASILSEADTIMIPDKKFMNVEFENVPCDVFLNPKLYKILERITKPGGNIKFSVSNCCRRLIVPVIQETSFGDQFIQALKNKFHILDAMHPTYHRINFTVLNK